MLGTSNMKAVFKEKDVVYVASFGWGIVIDAGCSTPNGWVGIETNSGRIIQVDTHFVSFTEYTLEGFTQERPEILPNKGDVVWVRDHDKDFWIVSHFIKKVDNKYIVSNNNPFTYSYTEYDEWNFMTTKNPYKNEDSI